MRKIVSIAAMLFLLAACTPPPQSLQHISADFAAKEAALQREMAVQANAALEKRLRDVSGAILTANAALCGDAVAPYLGAQFVTQDSMGKDYRETMAKLYGAGEYPTVTLVADKTPAAGKLNPGDIITRVNRNPLPRGKRSLNVLARALENNTNLSPMTLNVKRAGETVQIRVTPKQACSYNVYLVQDSHRINAYTDGQNIFVTAGMMRFIEDDTELATVLGHELAHNTMAHGGTREDNPTAGGILGAVIGIDFGASGLQMDAAAQSQDTELEADYIGLHYAARAGYDISEAPNLWRRMAATTPEAIHLSARNTHPSTARRFLLLENAAKEIMTKKARGKELIPVFKPTTTGGGPSAKEELNP